MKIPEDLAGGGTKHLVVDTEEDAIRLLHNNPPALSACLKMLEWHTPVVLHFTARRFSVWKAGSVRDLPFEGDTSRAKCAEWAEISGLPQVAARIRARQNREDALLHPPPLSAGSRREIEDLAERLLPHVGSCPLFMEIGNPCRCDIEKKRELLRGRLTTITERAAALATAVVITAQKDNAHDPEERKQEPSSEAPEADGVDVSPVPPAGEHDDP